MQVEIYDERELNPDTLKPECDQEAMALIEELGLTAQKTDSGARLCYPIPTEDQGFVMAILFPEATPLHRYDASGIPLRVLKEIRSYRAENPDHCLVVRHCPPATVKDPVLLAYTGKEGSWQMTHRDPTWQNFRLIARWGDALESWENLAAQAAKVAAQSAAESLRKIIRRAESMLAGIEAGEGWKSSSMPHLATPFVE